MTKYLKKLTVILLAIIMVFGVFTVVPFTASAATSDYKLGFDDIYYIAGYTGTDKELTLPSEIDGHTITGIGPSAFKNRTDITSVIIPDTVTSIWDRAFEGCTGLAKITIPDSVKTIKPSAFNNCTNLKDVYYTGGKLDWKQLMPDNSLPNATIHYAKTTPWDDYSYETLGDETIEITGYSGAETDLKIISVIDGKSVTSIGDYAFVGCTGLTSVTIPDNVIKIGNEAFSNCANLTKITIPNSVISIGKSAFGFINDNGEIKKIDNFTIYGYKGTIVEAYASENGFNFIALDDTSNPGATDPTDSTEPESTNPTDSTEPTNSTEPTDSTVTTEPTETTETTEPTVTTEPTETTEPTNPTVTTEPAEPTEPTNPPVTTEPAEPTEPAVPSDPTEPTEPIQPTKPNDHDNPDTDNTTSLGDIDGDGEISVNDVTDIQKYIVQLKPFTDEQMKFADVDKNGKIDVYDVTLLQKVIVKIAVI